MRIISGGDRGDEGLHLASELLRHVAQVTSEHDEGTALQRAVEAIAKICNVTCAAIGMATGDAALQALAVSAGCEGFAAAINTNRIPLGDDTMLAQAVLSGEPAVVRNPTHSERSALLRLLPRRDSVRAAVALPLAAEDGALGALVLFSESETAFSGGQLDALNAFAQVAAGQTISCRRLAQARSETQEQATHDDSVLSLHGAVDKQAVFRSTARFARAVTGARFAIAWELQANVFSPVCIEGDDAGYAQAVKFNADPNTPLGHGPAGRAVRSGEIELVKDAFSDRSFSPWADTARHYGVRSAIALPLADGQSALVLGVYSSYVDAFDASMLARLRRFLPHARRAAQRVLQVEATERSVREQTLHAAAATSVTRSLQIGDVVRSIARTCAEAAGAKYSVVYLAEGDVLAGAAGWNAPDDLWLGVTINAADRTMTGYPPVQAFHEFRLAKVHDAATDPAWLRQGWDQQALEHGFDSLYALPLLYDGRALGAVSLFFGQRPALNDADGEALMRLGSEGAAALEAAQAFERARSARDFLSRVLEESTDAIVQFDPHGAVVGWNKGAERIYGVSREDALGKLFHDMPLVDPQTRDEMREVFSRVARGEHVRSMEFMARSRAGEPIEMLFSASPSRDEKGNIVGLISFSKDISQQKKQYDQLLRQNSTLVVVRDVARSLAGQPGLAGIAQKGLDKILDVLRLDVGRVYAFDAGQSRLLNVALRGFSPQGGQPVEVRPMTTGEEGVLCSSAFYRQSMLLSDGDEIRLEHAHLSGHHAASISVVLTKPLTIGDTLVGAIQLIGFDGRHIGFEEQNIFHAVTEELAMSMQNAQLYDQAARMAITDPLTGLYNYRFMQDFLKKRLSEARRRKRPFSIIMADIDGLHAVNERFGHALGDQVIREFAAALAACVRLSDVVARYGGDEFVVLLPETQLSDALVLAERMTEAIGHIDWPDALSESPLSASIGCAAFPEAGSQMHMLLKAADSALFQAKQSSASAIYPRYDTSPKFAG